MTDNGKDQRIEQLEAESNIYRDRNAELEKGDVAIGQIHVICCDAGIDPGYVVDRVEALTAEVTKATARGDDYESALSMHKEIHRGEVERLEGELERNMSRTSLINHVRELGKLLEQSTALAIRWEDRAFKEKNKLEKAEADNKRLQANRCKFARVEIANAANKTVLDRGTVVFLLDRFKGLGDGSFKPVEALKEE